MEYLKINFDDSVRDRHNDGDFIIHKPSLRLMVTRKRYLFKPTIFEVKFCTAWMGIVYTWQTLQADHLIIEEDSVIIVA